MLHWRLILGAVFIAALVGLMWLDHATSPPGVVLLPLAVLLSLAAAQEILGFVRAAKLEAQGATVFAGSLLIVASCGVPLLWEDSPLEPAVWPLAALGLSMMVAFLVEMRRYTGPGGIMQRLALTVFCLVYAGLLLAFVALLRFVGPGASWGVPALASLVIVVKMCDIGAYTCGRLLGRHKMAPVLSPGKTMEGAVGGIVFACLGSWLALNLLFPKMTGARPPNEWMWLPYGMLIGLCGMAGDLAESLLKRDVGRKDSSDWLPGFGGVLDLLDSILFAAPLAYVWWRCVE